MLFNADLALPPPQPPLHRINISEHARHYCHLCESMGWGMSATVPYPLRSSPLPFDGNNKANQESGELFTGLSGANWDVKSRSRNPGAWNAGNIREGRRVKLTRALSCLTSLCSISGRDFKADASALEAEWQMGLETATVSILTGRLGLSLVSA